MDGRSLSGTGEKGLGRKWARILCAPRRLGRGVGACEAPYVRRWPTKRAVCPRATGSRDPVVASGDPKKGMSAVTPGDSQRISLAEASRISGVKESTLKRWAGDGIVPVDDGTWTRAAAAQARVVARMRERGYSPESVREAALGGRLAFGYTEDVFQAPEAEHTLEEVALQTGLEPELIERLMTLLGTPMGMEGRLNEQDLRAMRHCAEVLASGFPLVAFLQLVRVYAQALRRVADAEVRLFHLYVHEPMIQDGIPPLEMAEEMGNLAADLLPVTTPLMEYMHNRYLRFYIEQDVVGHMESDVGGGDGGLARVSMAFCFVDLTGFTRYTEEEGDEEALDVVERFVDTVEATLPSEAQLIKTIGDEVMIVSPDPATLTEWAVGFLQLFRERPQPRVGIHHGAAVFRDGDYFGGDVNLAHRVVTRALGGEVMVTEAVAESIPDSEYLRFDPIGEVDLKGFPDATRLYVVTATAG